MMIEHTIFALSNTILSNQNACLLSYNIMEEGLVEILLDQGDRANKFYPIIWSRKITYDKTKFVCSVGHVDRAEFSLNLLT